MKALIVEDELPLANVYEAMLVSIGFDVFKVDTMAEAKRILLEDPAIDLITLDLNLKDIQAPETIEEILNLRASNANAILVVVSGVLAPGDSDRAIKLGADGCIEKMDASTEPGFWRKLSDVLTGAFGSSNRLQRNTPLLEAMVAKVVSKCNAIGCPIGGAKTNPPGQSKEEIID